MGRDEIEEKRKTKRQRCRRRTSPSSSSENEETAKRQLKRSRSKQRRKRDSSSSSSSSSTSTGSSNSSSSSTSSSSSSSRDRKKIKKKRSKSHQDDGETCDIPLDLMDKSKAMAPMTKEQWEEQQNKVKRVYDETSGRWRLIKGSGEVIEEIVSRDRHKTINQQATKGDGEFFQSKLLARKKY